MYILGISAFFHDSAACLVKDGNIVAAAQEERFTRKKHDFTFPDKAIQFCLDNENITVKDLDYVGFYEKPELKFDRLLKTYLYNAPRGYDTYLESLKLWITKKMWINEIIKNELGYEKGILFSEHHESHAASAFFPSPFEYAAILTVDGVGEWATTTIGIGYRDKINILKEIRFPHSLGLLYSAFTYYTGFKVNSGEYKVMGLAPYGEPKYVDTILDNLIDLKKDGSFKLNMKYFGYLNGRTMTNDNFNTLFKGEPRKPESEVTQREMDLARSIQDVSEEILFRMTSTLYAETKISDLCLAGGVALNCVANGKIFKNGLFKNIWIQPAAGDAGGAVGVALYIWHQLLGNQRVINPQDSMNGSFLGPSFNNADLLAFFKFRNIPYKQPDDEQLFDIVSDLLIDGNIIGWFQGKMEFGPRALGNRSIIADPRNVEMQKKLNLKIKFRESFRPFAPSVLRDDMKTYFDIDYDSPYMLLVANVHSQRIYPMTEEQNQYFGIEKLNVVRSEIPAVTHVDYSARIQTVHQETNPRYYKLLSRFKEKTGCPILVNTSFNVRGEPIVCSPQDAYLCFMRTNMDYLVMENFILDKKDQTALIDDQDWKRQFTLD